MSDLTLDNMTDEQREEMCALCADLIFYGSVNTNQYNMCEGSQCTEAFTLYKDTLEDQIQQAKDELENIGDK